MTLVYVLLFIVIVAAVSLPARKFFKSLIAVGEAQLVNAKEAVLNTDPLSVYKSQIEEKTQNLSDAQKLLAKSAGLVQSSNQQVIQLEKEVDELVSRLKKSRGDDKAKKTMAQKLLKAEQNLNRARSDKDSSQKRYDSLLDDIRQFQDQIFELKKDVVNLGFNLEKSQVDKDMAEARSSLQHNLDMGDLAEARNRVQSKIDANTGFAKAADDLSSGYDDVDEPTDDDIQAVLDRYKN